MNSPRETDVAAANRELKWHLPRLIRWGVACLMVIGGLATLAAQGEGDVNIAAAIVFCAVWLGCLAKAGQHAFVVIEALIEKHRSSNSD